MEERNETSQRNIWWVVARAILLVLFFAVIGLWFYLRGFDVDALLQEVPREKSLKVGLLVFVLFTFVTVAPISVRDLLRIYSALTLGLWQSTFWIWLGETAAAVIAFGLARYLGRDFVEFLAGHRINELNRYLERAGFRTILLLRLAPMTPYRPFNFAAGFTRVHFVDYFLGSALGMIPHVFLYQLVYSSLGDFFRAKGAGILIAVNIIAAVITGIVVVLIGLWAKKRAKSNLLNSSR